MTEKGICSSLTGPLGQGARSEQELVRTSPRARTYRGNHVLLVPLQGAQPIRDLQQRGCPQLGATGNETSIVLYPEAEEGLVTHLLEGQADPGEGGERSNVTLCWSDYLAPGET